MGYCKQVALPAVEPVTIAQALAFLQLPSSFSDPANIIGMMISSAREQGERISDRCLAQRQFVQVLDSFPYYTDTIQSQLAYPPSYYSLPRYSTTLWNYSQMIKLSKSPVKTVDSLTYIGGDGNPATLQEGTDFIVDNVSEECRLFPMVGQFWPPCLYTPNAVQILFTAGYDPNPSASLTTSLPFPPPSPPNQQSSYKFIIGIPQDYIDGILNLVAYKFQNRGASETTPANIERLFLANAVFDFAPTRG